MAPGRPIHFGEDQSDVGEVMAKMVVKLGVFFWVTFSARVLIFGGSPPKIYASLRILLIFASVKNL